jgi:hypothetical protein
MVLFGAHTAKLKKPCLVSLQSYFLTLSAPTPDSQGQTQICKDVGITTYPTWHFTNDISTTTKVTTGNY